MSSPIMVANDLAGLLGEGIPDLRLLQKANSLYPTPIRAIKALRRMGKPRIGSLDSSNPDKDVETFLKILASLWMNLSFLAPEVTAALVKDNWTSLLSPWIFFVLEELVLTESELKTPAGRLAFNTTLWIVPSFFFPSQPESTTLKALRNLTPRLSFLFSRVWLKTIDQYHFTWGYWSTLLTSLYREDLENSGNSYDRIGNGRIFDTIQSSGAISIHHIHRQIPHIPTMSSREFRHLNAFLTLLTPFGKDGPLFDEKLPKNGLQALVDLLSALLHKRKTSLCYGSSSSGLHHELSSVSIILEYIEHIMEGNFRVSETVEAGLVPALMKASPYYFACNNNPVEARYEFQASRILEKISQYLVFPEVLHHFLQSVKKSEKSESKLRENSLLMWSVWDRTKQKALMLREIRSELKAAGRFWRCDNNLCNRNKLYTRSSLSYLRCTGCLEVVYCSKSCRSSHWRATHREDCEVLRRAREAGLPNVTDSDEQFLIGITNRFINSNYQKVTAAIADYVAVLSSSQNLSKERKLIVSGARNPIVVIDYAQAKATQMSHCAVVDPEDLIVRFEKRVGHARALHIVESCKQMELDSTCLFVVILLPMRSTESAVLAFHFNWLDM